MTQREFSEECEFCLIAAGRSPASRIMEDADVVAFFPLEPATEGHTLVVPKSHITDILHLTDRDMIPLMRATLRLARAIEGAFSPDGINLINSAGLAASQTVFHIHMHLVPRWEGDSFGPIWPKGEQLTPERSQILIQSLERELEIPSGPTQ